MDVRLADTPLGCGADQTYPIYGCPERSARRRHARGDLAATLSRLVAGRYSRNDSGLIIWHMVVRPY